MQAHESPNAGFVVLDYAAPGAATKTILDIISGNLLVTRLVHARKNT
jgi:hypothetical protein